MRPKLMDRDLTPDEEELLTQLRGPRTASGVWLAILKKVDGLWKLWRDMDTPSPEADTFYERLPPTYDVL